MIQCNACGHTMYKINRGYACIENTCYVGLANLGDFASAERRYKKQINERD